MTKIRIIKMLNDIIRQAVMLNFFLPQGHNQGNPAFGTILRTIDSRSIRLKKDFLTSIISFFKRMPPPACFFIKERKIRSNG